MIALPAKYNMNREVTNGTTLYLLAHQRAAAFEDSNATPHEHSEGSRWLILGHMQLEQAKLTCDKSGHPPRLAVAYPFHQNLPMPVLCCL